MIELADLSHSRSFRPWLVLMMVGVLMLAVVSCNTPPSPTPTTSVPGAKTPVPNVAVTVTSAPPVSSTPGGLIAEASDTVIKLKWSAVSDAAGYFIFRDGNEQPLNPKPLTETGYDDIGLTNGRTYTYTLAVADSSGKPGSQSAAITAVPASK